MPIMVTELSRLYKACEDDQEYEILEELGCRAGLLWKCEAGGTEDDPCGYPNHEIDRKCCSCDAPNPKLG